MKGKTMWRITVVLVAALLTVVGALRLRAQGSQSTAQLRDALHGRYEIVALQGGIGLVPRQRAAGIRMIEVRNGSVAADGITMTGRELRDKLGQDANLIVQLTYLDEAGLRELIGAQSSGGEARTLETTPARPPSASTEPADERERRRQGLEGDDRSRVRTDDLVRIGGSVTVGRDEIVDGDVAAIGGSGNIEGEVRGDVFVLGGSLNLGPASLVEGDVAVVGGVLNRAPGARVEGRINNVGFGRAGEWNIPGMAIGSFWQRVGSLAGTLLRVTLLILVGLVVVAAGRPSLERIASRSGADPVRSGLAGLLAELLFIPLLVITVVVLAVSIIGIPLLVLVPFGIVLFLLLLVVGFTGVAYQIGRWLVHRFGWTERGAYTAVVLGVLVITALTLMARLVGLAGGSFIGWPFAALGYLVEYIAWTVGLGATILAWYGARTAARAVAGAPPPLPRE